MISRILVLLLVVALVSCGGGGGGGGGNPIVFQISSVFPVDSQENVALSEQVNIFFTKAVDPSTLNPFSLQVVAESGDLILGSRTVNPINPNTARFLPASPYFPFAIHQIRVTTEVRDMDGNSLDRDYTFQFQTTEAGPVLPTEAQIEDLGDVLQNGRWFHRLTTLLDGRFLVAGGYIQENTVTDTAENLVPGLKQSFLYGNNMDLGRAAHVQVLLNDGRVLIAGGEISDDPFVPTRQCEIFDPNGSTFTRVAEMEFARSFAHGTILPDGKVLVTGGQGTSPMGQFLFRRDAEIYDPVANTWTTVPVDMALTRAGHFSAALPTGDVLLIGGFPDVPSAEIFDVSSTSFITPINLPSGDHYLAASTILADGRAFIAGGFDDRSVHIYDPVQGFLGATTNLLAERAYATSTPFPDGRVIVAGGIDLSVIPPLIHDTIEVFFPISKTGKVFPVPNFTLPLPKSHHEAAPGPNGEIWLVGGLPTNLLLPALKQVVLIHPN